LWMSVIGSRRSAFLSGSGGWSPSVAGCAPGAAPRPGRRHAGRSSEPVVRRFLGDLHVVHVALALAGAGDLHELRLPAHFLDRGAADVAHGRAQATGQLVDHVRQRATVWHAALDALGHELVGVAGILEVAVLGPLLHRAERAHAAVALVAAALE